MELTAGLVWLLVASALVLFMTPGLAFFYGGMTRAKSALNMMMMSFVAIGTVGIMWVLWGASMATSNEDNFFQIFANPFSHFGLHNFTDPADLLKVGYAATFAIITVALISGAVADRAKFSAWVIFTPIWATLVYAPLAFMVWGGGLFSKDGWFGQTFAPVIDFAGGTVVHINAGAAATVEQAGLIWINTLAAPAAAMLGWLAVERFRDGHPTSLGAASGVVAGLVAITPACANVSPLGAIALGVVAGIASALAVGLKFKLGYDDSLDVVGVHLVAGVIGTVAIGFLATPDQGAAGLFYGGGTTQLVAQVLAALLSIAFTAVMTFIIAFPIHKLMGFRVSQEQEVVGVDLSLHAETAYEFGVGGHGGSFQPLHELITGSANDGKKTDDEKTEAATGKESVGA